MSAFSDQWLQAQMTLTCATANPRCIEKHLIRVGVKVNSPDAYFRVTL